MYGVGIFLEYVMAAADLDYDYEDFGMSIHDLQAKYGDAGHPTYNLEGWRSGPNTDHDSNGYWDWVTTMIAQDDESFPDTPPEELDVKDLGQFIALLAAWHQRQVATLEHLQKIPPGTEVSVEDADSFTLEGDVLRGFQMGLSLALSHMGTLPFNAEFVDPDATKH